MQGFENMLKMMGFNPQALLNAAMTEIQPKLDQFLVDIIAKQKAEILNPLLTKLEAMDAQLKKLDPDYVPQDWALTLAPAQFAPSAVDLTNEDHPNGGAVDMASLDPAKLEAMNTGSVDQEAEAEAAADIDQVIQDATGLTNVVETVKTAVKDGAEVVTAIEKTVATVKSTPKLKGKGGIK